MIEHKLNIAIRARAMFIEIDGKAPDHLEEAIDAYIAQQSDDIERQAYNLRMTTREDVMLKLRTKISTDIEPGDRVVVFQTDTRYRNGTVGAVGAYAAGVRFDGDEYVTMVPKYAIRTYRESEKE